MVVSMKIRRKDKKNVFMKQLYFFLSLLNPTLNFSSSDCMIPPNILEAVSNKLPEKSDLLTPSGLKKPPDDNKYNA